LGFAEVSLVAERTGGPVPYTRKGRELCDPYFRWDTQHNPIHHYSRLNFRWVAISPNAEVRGRWDIELTRLFEMGTPGCYSLILARWAKKGGKLFMVRLPPLSVRVADKSLKKAENGARWAEPVLDITAKAFATVEMEANLPKVHLHVILKNVSDERRPAVEYAGQPALELWDLRWGLIYEVELESGYLTLTRISRGRDSIYIERYMFKRPLKKDKFLIMPVD